MIPYPEYTPTGASVSYPLLTDLRAYWDMSESSGTRSDSHSGARHLSESGGTINSRTGVGGSGTAADFVAADARKLTVTGTSIWPASLTAWEFCFWAVSDSDPAAASDLFDGFHNGASSTSGPQLTLNTNGRVQLRIALTSSTTAQTATAATADMAASTWYFVRCWWDGTNINVSFNNGTTTSAAAATFYQAGSIDSWWIGAKDAGTDIYFDGGIQAVGVWHRNLTSDERTWLYNSGSPRLYSAVSTYTG